MGGGESRRLQLTGCVGEEQRRRGTNVILVCKNDFIGTEIDVIENSDNPQEEGELKVLFVFVARSQPCDTTSCAIVLSAQNPGAQSRDDCNTHSLACN